jgi:hypothetical protein
MENRSPENKSVSSEMKTEAETENRKNRQFSSVRFGSGFFFGFGLKVPTPTCEDE